MKIVLIGFAASYKTSAGKLLADLLHVDFFDVDRQIETTEGKSVAEIFADRGEEYFRKRENDVLQKLTSASGVVACGGGSVLSEAFADFARESTVVWLQTTAQTVKSRLHTGRPLFDGLSLRELSKQVSLREQSYKKYATFCVKTDRKSPSDVAEEIFRKL